MRRWAIGSLRGRDELVEHLLVEVVGECEAGGHGPVGPLDDLSRLDQQPEPGDDGEPFLDLALGQLERSGHCRRRELGARDARRLEQVAILRSERGEPPLDERAKRSRDARGERLERNGEAYAAVHGDRALRQPRLDEAGHEQGIAAGRAPRAGSRARRAARRLAGGPRGPPSAASEESGASASSWPSPARASRSTSAGTGWRVARASSGRYVPSTSRRAASGRRAITASRSTVG